MNRSRFPLRVAVTVTVTLFLAACAGSPNLDVPECGHERPGQACFDPNHEPGDPYRMDPGGDTCDGLIQDGYCYPRYGDG
jgi:hypothetical protein